MATVEHKDLISIHRFAYVGSANPGAVGAYKAWIDTSFTPSRLKVRGAANTFWVDVGIWDQDLVDIAALTPADDDVIQRKGGIWTHRTIAELKTDLNLVIGTNVQGYDAELQAIANLTSAANKLPYFTGLGTASATGFTAAARSLLDDNSVADMRTTLELGTMALQNDGTININGGRAVFDFEGLTLISGGIGGYLLISVTGITTDKKLTLNVNNNNRTISLSGNLTVSSTATISGTNTGNELPSQTGNVNKVLITNGSTPLWYSGVLSGGQVASRTERLDYSGPQFMHVKQTDNTLSYILSTESPGPSVDSDWVALPPAGRKTFRAFIAQVTTGTPTMTTVENGLQSTPTWSRTGVGSYTLTLTGAFLTSKFFSTGGVWFANATDTITYSLYRLDNNSVKLFVTKMTASTSAAVEISTVLSDYSLTTLPLQFYVYS